MARKIAADVREEVRQRAKFLCEYCHTNERWQYVRFTVDHVIPGGENLPENLAFACFHCNRRKSNKTRAVDPETNSSKFLTRAGTFGKSILPGRPTNCSSFP